jgi:predicted chitinase
MKVTEDAFLQLFPGLDAEKHKRQFDGGMEYLLPAIHRIARENCFTFAAVVATVGHESISLTVMREILAKPGTPIWVLQARYKPYIGRGYIQNTWKSNYLRLSKEPGLEGIMANPSLLEQPKQSAIALEAYWRNAGLSRYTDKGDFLSASRIVNRGNAKTKRMPLGWQDRLLRYTNALDVLRSQNPVK